MDYEAHPQAVRAHLAAQRLEFRAAMHRISSAIHPEDVTVPADLPEHETPTGDRWHELGWAASVIVASIGGLVVIAGVALEWIK